MATLPPTDNSPNLPRFRLADAFILTTGVAVGLAIATRMSDQERYHDFSIRIGWYAPLVVGGLDLGGLICMARARRRRLTVGEWTMVVGLIPYLLIGWFSALDSIFGSPPQALITIIVRAVLFGVPASGFTALCLAVYCLLRPPANQPWTHWYGCVVGALVPVSIITFLFIVPP